MDWGPLNNVVVDRVIKVLFVVVGIAMVLPIVLFFLLGGVCGCSILMAPQAAFEYAAVERDGRPDALEIVHHGGDSLSTEQLYVVANVPFRAVDGDPKSGHRLTWRELGHDEPTVSAGDRVLIESAEPGSTIRGGTFDVRWWGENPDGELTWVVLERWNADATPALSESTPDADTPVPSLPPPSNTTDQTPAPTDREATNGSTTITR